MPKHLRQERASVEVVCMDRSKVPRSDKDAQTLESREGQDQAVHTEKHLRTGHIIIMLLYNLRVYCISKCIPYKEGSEL